MTPTWWAAWRDQKEKKDGLKIEKDAFAKTYEVKDKDGKVVMVFDYARNIVFTNHTPDQFSLDDEMSSKDMAEIKDKAEKISDDLAGVDPNAKKEVPPGKGGEEKPAKKAAEAEEE
jgi:predicted NUDIX family NTP pyrophosphohydrolase